jgi:hypothetical protein
MLHHHLGQKCLCKPHQLLAEPKRGAPYMRQSCTAVAAFQIQDLTKRRHGYICQIKDMTEGHHSSFHTKVKMSCRLCNWMPSPRAWTCPAMWERDMGAVEALWFREGEAV